MEKPKIELAAPKVIIKNEGLKDAVKSWEVGSRMTTSELAFFSSLLTPEDFYAIPEVDNISAWEVVSTPTFSSERLGSIKERGIVRPIPQKELTSLDIDESIKRNIQTALEQVKDAGVEESNFINLLIKDNNPAYGLREPVSFTLNNVVFDDDAAIKYRNKLTGSNLDNKPRGFYGEIYEDIGEESVEELYAMIHDSANTLGYSRRNAMNDLDIEELDTSVRKYGDYQSDVFEETVRVLDVKDKLKNKENLTDAERYEYRKYERLYEYFEETSGLFPYEEDQLINERNERAALTNPKEAKDEYDAKKKAMIEKNMAKQLSAFFDSYKENRNDYRGFLDGRQTNPSKEGFTEDEMTSMRSEAKILNDIDDENEKSYKRLERSAFKKNADGKTERIPDKTPRRPTDKSVMAFSGNISQSDSVPIEGFYKSVEEKTKAQLDQELKAVSDLLRNPYLSDEDMADLEHSISEKYASIRQKEKLYEDGNLSPTEKADLIKGINAEKNEVADLVSRRENPDLNSTQKEILENKLNEVSHQRENMNNKIASFRFGDQENGFGANLRASYEAMIAKGQEDLELAKENQKAISKEINRVAKIKAQNVLDLHGVSRQSVANIRSDLSNTSLSFHQSISSTIERLRNTGFDNIGDEFASARKELVHERNSIINMLERTLALHDEELFGDYTPSSYLKVNSGDLTNASGKKIGLLKGDDSNALYSFKSELSGARDSLAMLGHKIDATIEQVNLTRSAEPVAELERLQGLMRQANSVVKNGGYDKETMGATIVNDGNVHQIGLSKEDYIRYTSDPKELDKDIKNLNKHKVLVEKAKNMNNVSSWLDAERKGRIIAGNSNDTIGYTVKVSPDQKIAYLTQPAVRVDSLDFLDAGVTNAEVVAAIKSGNLDYDARPTSHIVDMEPVLDYEDKGFVSVISDPIKRSLFNEEVWDEKKIGYIQNDIDAIFDGREVKSYNLDDKMKDAIGQFKQEWEESTQKRNKVLIDAELARDDLIAEREVAQERMTTMRRNLSSLLKEQEDNKKLLLTASAEEAQDLRIRASNIIEVINELSIQSKIVSEEIVELNRNITEQISLSAKISGALTKGVIPEGLEVPGLKEALSTGMKIEDAKERAFAAVQGIHKEKEEARLTRVNNMLETLGVGLDDINYEEGQLIIDKQTFMEKMLINKNETNRYFAFNNHLRTLMGSQLTHVDPQDYGDAASGVIEMFMNSQHYGREFDIREEAYGRKILGSISSGTAIVPDELTSLQRKDYDARMASYAKMDVSEKLQASIFEELRGFIFEEMFRDGTDEPEYAHTIRQIQRRLADTYGMSNVSGEFISREISSMRKVLGKAEKIARAELEDMFADDPIPITKSMVDNQLSMMLDSGDERLMDIADEVTTIRQIPSNIFKLSAEEIDKVVSFKADVDTNPMEVGYGVAGDLERLMDDNSLERELFDFDQNFKEKLNDQYGELAEKFNANKRSYNYFLGKEIIASLEDGFESPEEAIEFRSTLKDMKEFVNMEREQQFSILSKMLNEGNNVKEGKAYLANVIKNMDKDVAVLPKYLQQDASTTFKLLNRDERWTDLVDGDNPYYSNVEERMQELHKKFGNYTGDKHSDESLALAREFKKLREFAVISMVDPEVAGKMADLETLSAILPEGDLMRRGLANPTTNLVSQMMQVAEEGGKSLRAVIQVPGEDFTTEVELRKLEDGTIEAYSEDLKQGYVVNDSGQGRVATARTDSTSAYARDNNIHAVQSASVARPVLREPIATHSLSKRSREAVNISNITASVVDSIQAAKDGGIVMGYDIETTMTGAKKIGQVIQPIDIYAEKFQYDPETGELLERDGRTYIKTQEERMVENPDGSFEYKKVDVEKHSSFGAVIALNDESKQLISDLSSDPSKLTINFGKGKGSMHIADIADALEWRKEMDDVEMERFNARKNKFLAENLMLDKNESKRIKGEIDLGLEHLRFLSNVSKYSMSVDERGLPNPLDLPKGTLDLSREKGVFELFSQGRFVPTHEEIMQRLLHEHSTGNHSYVLRDRVANMLFGTDEEGRSIRLAKGEAEEKMVVLGIQQQYTDILFDSANKASKILDSKELSKAAFGQDIYHFKNQEEGIKAFREFAEMDNVVALLGSNIEKADNVTMVQSLPDKPTEVVYPNDPLPSNLERKQATELISQERNRVLNEAVGQFTEDFGLRFVFNPVKAEEFHEKIDGMIANGENADGYIKSRKSIVVKDLSDALSYLPTLTGASANVTADSDLVKGINQQLADLTHAFEVAKGVDGVSLTSTDKSIFEKHGLFVGRSFDGPGEPEIILSEKAKLENFFNRTAVIDQQIVARQMFPQLRSLSNESILTAMGVDISDAHASNVDVGSNIRINSAFIGEVFNILGGGEVKYPGVKAVLDNLGITKDTVNIYEQQSYKVGDFVYMREAYDNTGDKDVTKGQVGVYRIEELNDEFTSMTLSRQIQGTNGMIEDTSIERLPFSASNNAMFASKAANKLRFISDSNDESVAEVAQEYQRDISRQHFQDIISSDNKYYIHASQAASLSKVFENNPLFQIDNAASIIDISDSKGMVSLGSTPLENARGFYIGAQAILNQESFGVTEGQSGKLDFFVGSQRYSIRNSDDIQKINMNGMDVEVQLNRYPVDELGRNTGVSTAVINPLGTITESNFSADEQNILRSLQGNIDRLNSSDTYYVPEISKEHLQALNEIDQFNNTGIGQETRRLMDDVVTLRNLNVIDDNEKAGIISKWNEALIERANEYDARTPVRNMGVLDRIDYQKTNYVSDGVTESVETVGATLRNRSINLSSPKDVVDSMVSIARDIGRDYTGVIPGTENKETHIATKFIVDPMIQSGLLPEDFKTGLSGNISLDHIAVTAVNHTREHGIANPLTRIDHLELANIMDETGSYEDFANVFRANTIDNIINGLTTNQEVSFEASKELLQRSVDNGIYVNGMNMTAPIDLNVEDAITLEQLKSKSFFTDWTVDDLVQEADGLIGSDREVDIRMNQSIYGELAKRASGGITGEAGINPELIKASGDMERIEAAVALDWLKPLNTKINGEQQYSVVPIQDRRIAYSRNAGMVLNDMMLRDINYATHKASVSQTYNPALYHQQQELKRWQNEYHNGYDLDKKRQYHFNRVGGVLSPDEIVAANQEIIERAEEFVRPDNTRPEIADNVVEPRTVRDFVTPINNVGADGQPLLNTTTVDDMIQAMPTPEIPERVIEPPTTGRPLSEAEAFIGDTKSAIRGKMDSFLNGSSGGKWVAGLGVAAAALYAVNSMAGPLKLEDRPQGHGVKGFAGAPEDDNRTQRETKSVQVDTSSKAYVNGGDGGYTIQAKGRAGSNIDTGQLQNAVSGMQGASSVNVNIRDDRSSIDSGWLENQFSNYINRGYAGE